MLDLCVVYDLYLYKWVRNNNKGPPDSMRRFDMIFPITELTALFTFSLTPSFPSLLFLLVNCHGLSGHKTKERGEEKCQAGGNIHGMCGVMDVILY